MKTMLSAAILVSLMIAGASNADAQTPSLLNLARDVDQAASNLNFSNQQNLVPGLKKFEMPKLFSGLTDARVKKPTIPGMGLLDKLKNFGKPQLNNGAPTTQGPILAGLSRLLPQRNTSTPSLSLMDRLLGKSAAPAANNLTFSPQQMGELTQAAQGLQQHVGRMSQEMKAKKTSGALFEQFELASPQPPLRSARQYSGQSELRYK